MRYVFEVVLETDTIRHAHQVMDERLDYDEVLHDRVTGEEFDYQFITCKEVR